MPSLDDLRPKNFKISLKGVELDCSPPRLSHSLIITKVAEVLDNPKTYSASEIKQAVKDMDDVITEMIPSLVDIPLGLDDTISVINQVNQHSRPSDNQYLEEAGVKFDDDPKVTGTAG